MLLTHRITAAMQVAAVRQRLADNPDRGRGSRSDWLEVYQTTTILALAPLEGAVFFCLIAHLLEGSPLSLGGAVAVLVVMLLYFPTRSGVEAWVVRQQELMEQERQRRL